MQERGYPGWSSGFAGESQEGAVQNPPLADVSPEPRRVKNHLMNVRGCWRDGDFSPTNVQVLLGPESVVTEQACFPPFRIRLTIVAGGGSLTISPALLVQ